MTMIPNQRHLFDIPEDVAYFNTATMGPMTKASVEAGQRGLARKLQPWTIPDTDFFADTERLRPLLAELIGADTDGIAFAPSATYGLATAARNLPLSKGQEILVMEDQFPSNVYIWHEVAERTGATIRTVGPHGDTLLSDALLAAIGPETGIVATANIRWTDGALIDLVAIGRRCREVGAALVLDLTQSCGAMHFDVKEVQPDFAAVAGYKWLLGPYATGFLYVAPQHRNGTPVEQSWLNRKGASNFARLVDYTDAYAPGAQRFDVSERANFALLPAMEEAVRTLLEWGVANIEETLGARNAVLAEQLEGIGLTCTPARERGAHYLCTALPDHAPEDLVVRLREDGVYTSRRGDRLRITQHLFATDTDVEHFIARLGHHLNG